MRCRVWLAVLGFAVVAHAPALSWADGKQRQPQRASGGALSKVTAGVRSSQSRSSSQGAAGASARNGRSTRSTFDTYDYQRRGCYTCPIGGGVARPGVAAATTPGNGRLNVEIAAGVQSVQDSDRALLLRASAFGRYFGGEVLLSSYVEGPAGSDIRMNLVTANGMLRVYAIGKTSAWIVGGVGHLSASNFMSTVGPTFGVRVTHQLTSQVSVAGTANHYVFADDININQYRAAVRASVLEVGYRRLDFNVGPALQGPEVGFAFAF